MTEGRKERETPRFRFVVGEAKGCGVRVDLLLGVFVRGMEGRVAGGRDAYKPRDTDWLRDSSGRSNSEPGGIYAVV